jgi:hypothetical protein
MRRGAEPMPRTTLRYLFRVAVRRRCKMSCTSTEIN